MKPINIDDPHFKNYLLNEFFWELAQHNPFPVDFVDVQKETIEVLSFNQKDDLRIRVENVIYDIHLSWRGDVPPSIHRIDSISP